MGIDRRGFIGSVGAATLGAGLGGNPRPRGSQKVLPRRRREVYDVAVIGAGVFGSWTAWHLTQRGLAVAVLDAFGPGNARASSGGESRIIRMGYGPDEIYTRSSWRSLTQWKELSVRWGDALFYRTGVLFMAREEDPRSGATLETLRRVGVPHEQLGREELERRFPQIDFGSVRWAIFEPESGAILARRAAATVLFEATRNGADYVRSRVPPPHGKGRLDGVETLPGETLKAGTFVFACGPWLPKLFPDLLEERLVPTRQEVFYFGPPPGDLRFAPPALPAWIDFPDEIYGVPDLEGRGFKIAPDRHGEPFDPDDGERLVKEGSVSAVRAYLRRRFPALAEAPLVETRVCQYENTSNGDFLVDRHPALENVWLVGGGSGHGFKHGPALGAHVAARLAGEEPPEPRFSLATKEATQKRSVY